MDDEDSAPLDDPPPRPVVIRWVWPGRFLLSIGDSVSTVLTGSELRLLAGEVAREMGRR